MARTLLEINDLHTHFPTKDGTVKAVNGVSLQLKEDSILGLVGESGSGKTVTALSVLRLLPSPGQTVRGRIWYQNQDLLRLEPEEMRRIRGQEIALIFQDAGSSLNPVITVGQQVEETVLAHTDMSSREARARAVELLAEMGIPDAKGVLGRYPFQLSGGMAQRVMLAIGVAHRPKVLIADEPTSNLDVTLQAEILQRLRQLRDERHTAILLITHDLGVIAQMADTVAVMYGGSIVEMADTPTLFKRPLHPYTWGLFQSLPRLDGRLSGLRPLRGAPPQMIDPPDRCPYVDRCPKAVTACRTQPMPRLVEVEPDHWLACYNRIVHTATP